MGIEPSSYLTELTSLNAGSAIKNLVIDDPRRDTCCHATDKGQQLAVEATRVEGRTSYGGS